MSEEIERAQTATELLQGLRAEKPIHELLRETIRLGEPMTAHLLVCDPRFIISWFPRRLPDDRLEPGWEPSSGFIAAALAILRNA